MRVLDLRMTERLFSKKIKFVACGPERQVAMTTVLINFKNKINVIDLKDNF